MQRYVKLSNRRLDLTARPLERRNFTSLTIRSDPSLTDENIDLLWKQFALNVDVYKFYLDLVIKINVFHYAITGAIISYYFQHKTDGVAR